MKDVSVASPCDCTTGSVQVYTEKGRRDKEQHRGERGRGGAEEEGERKKTGE